MTQQIQRFADSAWNHPLQTPEPWQKSTDGRVFRGRLGEVYRGELYWDVSTIEAQVVLDEVLCLARPLYKLDRACRIVRTPELRLSVDSGSVVTAAEKVEPLEEPVIDTIGFTRTNLDLWKNVAHIAVEDEAQKAASHDVLRLNIEDAAKAIASVRNSQISTELSTAANVAGSTWETMTTAPNNDSDPWDDICGVLKTLADAGYSNDLFMAVDPQVWCAFISSTYVRDLVDAGIMKVTPSGSNFTIPGFPDVEVIVDSAITDTVAIIGSKRATVLGEGPTEAAKYRHEPKAYTGYVIRQWIEPSLICTSGIKELTGVHA